LSVLEAHADPANVKATSASRQRIALFLTVDMAPPRR
jgi:hypothetical protein